MGFISMPEGLDPTLDAPITLLEAVFSCAGYGSATAEPRRPTMMRGMVGHHLFVNVEFAIEPITLLHVHDRSAIIRRKFVDGLKGSSTEFVAPKVGETISVQHDVCATRRIGEWAW
jgi:hypothetical protein